MLAVVMFAFGCSDPVELEANDPTSDRAPESTIGTTPLPPTTESETSSEPVPLPELGRNVWLIQDWQRSDIVVRTNDAGAIEETLWEQGAEAVEALDVGHTLVCDDVDLDGEIDLVDLRFAFEGDLKNVYRESRSVDGVLISEMSRPVDGTSVPDEVHEICGEASAGPFIRLTARQWSAALELAGFTDIAGDHAIDPVWAAAASWEGVEYSPLNLFQGDFRPEPNEATMLVECGLGAIEYPTSLVDGARSALLEVSDC